MDWDELLVNQLLDGLDLGYLKEETIGKFFYAHLESLMKMTEQVEDGKEFYLKIKSYLEEINLERLRRQETIIIGFMVNYASVWIGDELYRLLEESERFEPYVFLFSNHNGQSKKMIKEEYEENLNYFKRRGLRVIQTLDTDTGEEYSWEEIGIKPEVCIWLTPWSINLFCGQFQLQNYPLDTLHTYIPYGFMAAENRRGDYVYEQYNQTIHNVAWKNFEESRMATEMAEKYAFVGDSNAVYTGYPKMDMFYESNGEEADVWKRLTQKAGNPNAKKIIYAPHHTLDESEPVNFSTFAVNYLFLLEMAEKYGRETVWIFKPHPLLKYKAIRAGIFADEDEWNIYEQRWRNLKNTAVMDEGVYNRLFCDSDAMILDSVSFLTEYLYAHKPLLLLRRDDQFFNDFGRELMKIHYCADGADYEAIENFIIDVILGENDRNREKREAFFEANLDYKKISGKSAAWNIYMQLERGLNPENGDLSEGTERK